jgi:CRP-like cAMP-binding protein
VLQTTRVARLDRSFQISAARWPGILAELTSRAIQRSRLLAFHRAVAQLPSLRMRLLVLLWYLADRWGRVNCDGVVVPLRLSHQILGGLVGAARPSVSVALGALVDQGSIARAGDGRLILRHDPPVECLVSVKNGSPGGHLSARAA